MLDRLVDLIVNFIELFYFSFVVDEYERGVMLRFGKYHRDLLPGIHFKIPFRVDVPIVISVVPDATRLQTQVFTLADGTTVALTPVLTYRVHNVKKALLEVEDAETSLHDATAGAIRRLVSPHPFQDLQSPDKCAEIEMLVTKDIRSEAFKWGYEVLRVQFPDMVKLKGSYQLFGDQRTSTRYIEK